MGRIIFCLVLLFNTHFIFSQNEYLESVDSLNYLIDNEENSIKKINLYVVLGNIYKANNLIEFSKCNEEMLQILQSTKATKEYRFYYQNQAYLLAGSNDYKQALVLSEKANKLFYENKDWDNYILNSIECAFYLSINEQNDKSISLLQKTLQLALQKKSKYVASVYYAFCKYYNGNSDYVKALEFAKKALSLEKDRNDIIKIYDIISGIYNSLGNYEKALEYNNLVIEHAIITNQKAFFYKTRYNKSRILFHTQRYQECLDITLDCLEYYKKNNYVNDYYDSMYFISRCYFKLKQYDLANFYIDNRIKLGFKRRIVEIDCKAEKAKISIAVNDLKIAKKYLDISISLLKEDDYFEMKLGVYEIKEELEEKLGNYKLALFYNQKISAIKETNYNKDNKNKLHQLEVELDVTVKNNRIKNLQIAQLKKQVELTAKNDYLVYALFSVLFLGGLVLFYVYNHNLIKTKNTLINISNTKLANERDKSQKSLLEKETLLKEIHHRVKNNMQLVISLLKIQARDSKQLSIDDFIEISENRIRSMALIHEYLYESENISFVNFEEYVKRLLSSIKSSFSGLQVQLETDINEANFDIETSISLGLIINELVINAYKHAFTGIENGVIKIKLINEDGFYHLTIQDNGVGIPANIENGKSVGLKIVKLLVSQISGTLTILNDSGAKFVIQFKKITLPNYE